MQHGCSESQSFTKSKNKRAILAVDYVRAVLELSRSVQGGKGSLRHLPNIKLIGQQALCLSIADATSCIILAKLCSM